MRRACVYQPGYFPRLYWFNRVLSADVFVVLCCAQFTRNDWNTRLSLRDRSGRRITMTVPVKHVGTQAVSFRDVPIDDSQPWRRKHLNAIRMCYARAPYFAKYWDRLQEVYEKGQTVSEFLVATQDFVLYELGYTGEVVFDHDLDAGGRRGEWMLNICKAVGADVYLGGRTAYEEYMRGEVEQGFARDGVQIWIQDWQPREYPQLGRSFIANLSVLDLLLNVGPEGAREILKPDWEAWVKVSWR